MQSLYTSLNTFRKEGIETGQDWQLSINKNDFEKRAHVIKSCVKFISMSFAI